MNRTTSLKQTSFKNLLRNTGCVALAVALNAGAACALASFDTQGERHLAEAASRGAQRTYVVYLGEMPAVNVCARKV